MKIDITCTKFKFKIINLLFLTVWYVVEVYINKTKNIKFKIVYFQSTKTRQNNIYIMTHNYF